MSFFSSNTSLDKPIVKLKLGASLHADRLREQNDIYLDCITDANPTSSAVRFLKDGQPIQPETGVFIANQTLVLQQVRRRFRGTYTCEASNNVGRSQSNDLYLRIQCKCAFFQFYILKLNFEIRFLSKQLKLS